MPYRKIIRNCSCGSDNSWNRPHIYELSENDGTIKMLPDYKGLPSDENYLNSSLEDSNELFAQLQEIEKDGDRFF